MSHTVEMEDVKNYEYFQPSEQKQSQRSILRSCLLAVAVLGCVFGASVCGAYLGSRSGMHGSSKGSIDGHEDIQLTLSGPSVRLVEGRGQLEVSAGGVLGDSYTWRVVGGVEPVHLTTHSPTLQVQITADHSHTSPFVVSATVESEGRTVGSASVEVGYYSIRSDVLLADEVCKDFACPLSAASTTLQCNLISRNHTLPADGYRTFYSKSCNLMQDVTQTVYSNTGVVTVKTASLGDVTLVSLAAKLYEAASIDVIGEVKSYARDQSRDGVVMSSEYKLDKTIVERSEKPEFKIVDGVHVETPYSAKVSVVFKLRITWGSVLQLYTDTQVEESSLLLKGDFSASALLIADKDTGVDLPDEHKKFEFGPTEEFVTVTIPIPYFPEVNIGVSAGAVVGLQAGWHLTEGLTRGVSASLNLEAGPTYNTADGVEFHHKVSPSLEYVSKGSLASKGTAQIKVWPYLNLRVYIFFGVPNTDKGLELLELGQLRVGPTLEVGVKAVTTAQPPVYEMCVSSDWKVGAKAVASSKLPLVAGARTLEESLANGDLLQRTCTEVDSCINHPSYADCDEQIEKNGGCDFEYHNGEKPQDKCCKCGGGFNL